ncbi:hypothetical protein KY389_14805 [Paracoccus bogoriensis]|uniref:hypothetical protein n=1 Tax=Paracoccus bogoriensis TaxID=242065 RepID=UPI001CA509EE|nr:hypothetical protein [Paracoccus bogoriensis]MBW7057924.1 hypothetical protein [Paracoccus bogoriensis]
MELTALQGDTWTKRMARIGFPILVEYARQRREITYGEWDDEIVRRGLGSHVHLAQYGYPAGSIGDACEEYSEEAGVDVPLINLMVVNKGTRVPGSGSQYYIEQFCRQFLGRKVAPERLSVQEKRAIIERALEEIYDFQGWDHVLGAYGLSKTRKKRTSPASKKKRRRPNPKGWHTGPESDEHKALKRRIASEPGLVGLARDGDGAQEFRLWSGDEVDVYFGSVSVGVEVKTASAGFDELHRGIFQCVKYRAVLRAQQIHDRVIPTADCIFATGGRLPDELRDLAQLLGIRFVDGLGEET